MRTRRIHRPRPAPAGMAPRPPGPLMRWDVINEFLKFTEGRRFLEIGVQFGKAGARIRAERWGVDPEPQRNAPANYQRFYKGPSDDFFAVTSRDHRFDVVFVDGLHHADQALRDVDNALEFLAPGGVVLMHDCNPASELAQRVPRATGVWNGDVWKAMVALRQRSDLDAFTIDADHGIGVVQRRPNPAPLTDVPEQLTYEALARDRARLLGLVSPSRWEDRAGGDLALGRVVVLSAIFGGRDAPLPVPSHDVDEYLLVTDGPGAAGWTVRQETAGGDPRRAARRVKTLALELVDADVVVWVDGRIRVSPLPLRPLLRRALRGRCIAGYPHPWRGRVAQEARECARLGLADPETMRAQMQAYRDEGFPDAAGLWNTMVLARRDTPECRALGRAWWAELERHTLRDQVSLPPVLWRLGLECGRLGDDVYREGSSPNFERGWHASSGAA